MRASFTLGLAVCSLVRLVRRPQTSRDEVLVEGRSGVTAEASFMRAYTLVDNSAVTLSSDWICSPKRAESPFPLPLYLAMYNMHKTHIWLLREVSVRRRPTVHEMANSPGTPMQQPTSWKHKGEMDVSAERRPDEDV